MRYCHECGSEVANLDLFCPYCGISQPIPDDTLPADDPMASTIVIPSAAPVELSERLLNTDVTERSPVESALSTEDDIRIDTATEESIRVDTATIETKGITGEVHFENEFVSVPEPDEFDPIDGRIENELNSEASIAEIPTPLALLEEAEDKVNEDIDEKSSAVEIEIPDNIPENPSFDGVVEDSNDIDSTETLEAEEHYETAEPVSPEDEPEDEIEEPSFIAKSEVEPDDAIEDGDEVHSLESEAEEAAVVTDPVVFPEENQPEESSVAESAEISAEISAESIITPEDTSAALGETEIPPVVDEVLNVQTLETQSETSIEATGSEETNGETDPVKIVEPQVVPETDDVPLVADSGDNVVEDEPRSHTTPQIGTVNTDGRKSGLKPLPEGTVLNNRYDIVRKIGGGGMGAVYLATDRNLGGVTRAVKEMVQSHIEEEQQAKAIDDFKRESMILSSLDHPSIPTIYDYFFDEQESRFYLVMKYISGGDLAGRLRAAPEGRIDERTVVEWAIQVIDVLDYLHNLPSTIVYRDLKPSNIMIDGNSGRTMLIDFGIARSINQNQEKGVTAVGTMGYAPPELFSGNVEPRSDIYSLGSTMFHLLTGADPQNNPLLIFDFQKNPRPRQINPQLSDQIERILMRSVEYNADSRFSSASETKRALSDHLENLKVGQITFGVTEIPQSVSLSNQVVFCGFCGQRIVATDMFCAFCGSKQPLAQHGVHSEVYSSRPTGTAKLVLVGTSDLDSPAYAIEKQENLVGRRDPMSNIFPEVDLSKYDPQTKISRRHAKIWRDGQNYLIEDLGSSNGTLLLTSVNDTMRLLPNQPHPLASGDRLRVGDTTLHFIVG